MNHCLDTANGSVSDEVPEAWRDEERLCMVSFPPKGGRVPGGGRLFVNGSSDVAILNQNGNRILEIGGFLSPGGSEKMFLGADTKNTIVQNPLGV